MGLFYFLTFSDAAKYADVARNISEGNGFVTNFTFFNNNLFKYSEGLFPVKSIPKLYPYMLSIFFRIFGPGDNSVLLLSWAFYLLSILVAYFLGKKLFGKLSGLLFSIVLAMYIQVLDFARTGAVEMFFIFELLLSFYLLSFNKIKYQVVGLAIALLTFLTKPQAVLFVIPLFLVFCFRNFSLKKLVKIFLIILAGFMIFDYVYFKPVYKHSLIYPIVVRGMEASRNYYPGEGTSNRLRGSSEPALTNEGVAKKTFYNLYNFYRLIPQYMSPYLFSFFIFSLLWWSRKRDENLLKLTIVIMTMIVFIATAFTIPLLRYLIPVVPLIYLYSIGFIVFLVRRVIDDQWLGFKKYFPEAVFKKTLIVISAGYLILIFSVGQSAGVLLLDSRFEDKMVNSGKPRVYVELGKILLENTTPDDLIVTNLDTWGSWYGERKTVWFPLKPDMLKNPKNGLNPFDAIYLTSYLIDDENYYMGPEWRQIFDNPQDIENDFIRENFVFVQEFKINADSVYEKYDARAILLTKKQNTNSN